MEHSQIPHPPTSDHEPRMDRHTRIVGVDRLTALTLEARVAIEATR